MVIKSIQFPTLVSSSNNNPIKNVIAPQSKTDFVLPILKRFCQLSITASNILIREVIPAKQTDKKKRTENSLPIGICLNTFGKVINIKDGPADGSIPKANTAGIIASAASSAAIVSKISVCKEDFTISSFFGR